MTLIEFAKEYREMRDLQTRYFQTRSQMLLQECKRRERALDSEADAIIKAGEQNV